MGAHKSRAVFGYKLSRNEGNCHPSFPLTVQQHKSGGDVKLVTLFTGRHLCHTQQPLRGDVGRQPNLGVSENGGILTRERTHTEGAIPMTYETHGIFEP